MTSSDHHRCGFIAVVGRPNVGKSTLINTIVGSKVSIVSPKPQTTRHRILGVRNEADSQLIFVDTPGLHDGGAKAMNRVMNRTARAALTDADVVLLLCEAGRWAEEDEHALQHVIKAGRRVTTIAVLNKIDRLRKKSALLEDIAALAERHAFAEIVPLSAKSGDNVPRLVATLIQYLPASPPLYTPDMVTDRSLTFRVAELIREKLTLLMREELPYGLTVQVERIDSEGAQMAIDAIIWVERDSQKAIVIGKGGGVLKRAGKQAREDLVRELGRRVHLELWVKVKSNWADSEADLRQLGYDLPS